MKVERRSVSLVGPLESAEFTGRVSLVGAARALSWQEAVIGRSRVRLLRTDAHRFERTPVVRGAAPRRLVLLIGRQGRLRGRFGRHEVDLARGGVVISDSAEPALYECSDGARILGMAVDSAALGTLGGSPRRARLDRTPLVRGVGAFAAAMLAEEGDRPAAGSVEDLDRAVCDLQARVLAEARAAWPDADLRTGIERYIDAHLADSHLGPQRIADAFGISLRQAHLVFSRGDETLARSIRDRRADAVAAELLQGSAAGWGDLVRRFGFDNRNQLDRAFRQRFGTSVTAFRAAHAHDAPPE